MKLDRVISRYCDGTQYGSPAHPRRHKTVELFVPEDAHPNVLALLRDNAERELAAPTPVERAWIDDERRRRFEYLKDCERLGLPSLTTYRP